MSKEKNKRKKKLMKFETKMFDDYVTNDFF